MNKGHHGRVKLDGLKFWFAGDKGDAKTVELTFEPSATGLNRSERAGAGMENAQTQVLLEGIEVAIGMEQRVIPE